ncbi:MAG: hypothetical protein ACLQVK_21590 [Acidimicrobiales bacterium]
MAAVAGGWLGARWGATAVPATWVFAVHGGPGFFAARNVFLPGSMPDPVAGPASSTLSRVPNSSSPLISAH